MLQNFAFVELRPRTYLVILTHQHPRLQPWPGNSQAFTHLQSLSVDSNASSAFGFSGYPTPLATPAQSVPSSPTLSPCRSPVSKSSPECIDPHKLFSFDANEDSGMTFISTEIAYSRDFRLILSCATNHTTGLRRPLNDLAAPIHNHALFADIEIDVVTVDDERNAGSKRSSGALGAGTANKAVCHVWALNFAGCTDAHFLCGVRVPSRPNRLAVPARLLLIRAARLLGRGSGCHGVTDCFYPALALTN
jgi:hypothetical protein